MAASGPSQRKVSISTLVYSTLGPSLGLLPDEDKSASAEQEWLVVEQSSITSPITGVDPEPNEDLEISRPRRTPDTSGNPSSMSECRNGDLSGGADPPKPKEVGEVLCRLYSAPSSLGKKNRLGFRSKSGAGSMSSVEQATLSEQSSASAESVGPEPPPSPVAKQQLQGHISDSTPRFV